MKRKVSVLVLAMSLGIIGTTVVAQDVDMSTVQGTEITQDVEGRASDTIEMKYRYHNGHLQCRRWNATKGRWVDPDWITLT